MNALPVRNTTTKDILYFKTQSFCSGFWLIQNPDVSIASKSLPLIQHQRKLAKLQENSSINSNKKKESIKVLKPRKHLALRKQSNLFMYKRKQQNKNSPIPKIFKSKALGMSWISDLSRLTMVQLCSYRDGTHI